MINNINNNKIYKYGEPIELSKPHSQGAGGISTKNQKVRTTFFFLQIPSWGDPGVLDHHSGVYFTPRYQAAIICIQKPRLTTRGFRSGRSGRRGGLQCFLTRPAMPSASRRRFASCCGRLQRPLLRRRRGS